MNYFQFFKEQYYFELERKESLSNSFGNYVAALTFLIGILVYYASWVISTNQPDGWTYIIIASSSLVITMLFLLLALYTPLYKSIKHSGDLLDSFIEFKRLCLSDGDSVENINMEIEEQMIENLAHYTQINGRNNDRRAFLYHITNIFLSISFLIILFLGYHYVMEYKPVEMDVPKKIEVIGLESIRDSIEKTIKNNRIKIIGIEIVQKGDENKNE